MNEHMYTFAETAERCFLTPEQLWEFLHILGIPVEEDGNGNPFPVSAGRVREYQERMVALERIMKEIDDVAAGKRREQNG
jgi:hypothetical protein